MIMKLNKKYEPQIIPSAAVKVRRIQKEVMRTGRLGMYLQLAVVATDCVGLQLRQVSRLILNGRSRAL